MAGKDWSAAQYLKFNTERTRAARDLLAQVPLASPRRVVDLGCGPGNSTQVLVERYPAAQVSGMDSSPDMIRKAQATLPQVDFTLGDLKTYRPAQPVDLFFSNAVLQWILSGERLQVVADLLQLQAPGGVFAFQVPNNWSERSHAAMREVAAEGPWAQALAEQQPLRDDFETPQQIYDKLAPLCSSVDVWESAYYHVMDGHESIVEWLKATGLKPYVDPLSNDDRDAFIAAYLQKLRASYPVSSDGKVLLRFPRLFVVAIRK